MSQMPEEPSSETQMSNVDEMIENQRLGAPIKPAINKFPLIPEFLKVRGLVKQHLDSFNYFVNVGIKKIVHANDRIVSTVDPSISLWFKDVRIGTPSVEADGILNELKPHACRLSGVTYAAPIYVNINYRNHDQKVFEKNDVVIGSLPIMLRSCCCLLYGKDEAEVATLGECPLDPGGYFIVKGTENVILIQEQLSKNRIIIDTDNKGNINASVTSSTEAVRSKTVILMEKEKLYLSLNQFAKKIPIMVILKAMGMQSDQEVVQMVGRDPRYGALLLPSIEECSRHNIYTRQDALKFLEGCALDNDGIAAPGETIRQGDIYINKETPIVIMGTPETPSALADMKYRPSAHTFKYPEGESCVVDRVALYSDKSDNLCINLIARHTRRPELGDKFSSRHGQKGVCGTIVQQEDFPFSERGICPDLIMNPHGFPSRMTVGKMIELLGSKAGVSSGRFHYGSAFGEPSGHADRVEAISETLVNHGFSYNGKDLIYSGITGSPLQSYIFMGPIYYQKLKHMVMDKMHARGNGPRTLLTRQPTEGRARNGGLCVGEMERDCLIAYGASMLIFERLMLSSDPFEVQVCRKCGLLGYYSQKLRTGICSTCKNGETICTMKLPYACKLLIQELQSMNIVPRLKLAET